MSAYIPPELIEKHRLRVAARVPADHAVTARITNDESVIRRRLAHALAERMAERVPLGMQSMPFDGGREVGYAIELFVFTRAELAELLETRFVYQELLRHERD